MTQKIKIAAVMVIYKEKIISCESFQSLLRHLPAEDVLVYDNSPAPQEPLPGMNYLHDPSNPGVSFAYNLAASRAIEKGYSHLLLLDSDSIFPEDAISCYEKEAEAHLDRLILPEVVANGNVISPFWFKWGKSWYGENIPQGPFEFKKISAINSGTLTPLLQYRKTNGYDEDIPLDWSDIAFCRHLSKFKIGGFKMPMKVRHHLSESVKPSFESAKFRYKSYMIGMKRTPSKHFFEGLLMLIWAKLKAIKLCLKYKSFWFLQHYSRKLINA